jgi:hypothetical protein
MATEELIAELISMVRALSFCTLAFVRSLRVKTRGRVLMFAEITSCVIVDFERQLQ